MAPTSTESLRPDALKEVPDVGPVVICLAGNAAPVTRPLFQRRRVRGVQVGV